MREQGKIWGKAPADSNMDAGIQVDTELSARSELFDAALNALKELFRKPEDEDWWLMQEINHSICQMAKEIEIERLQKQIDELAEKQREVENYRDHRHSSYDAMKDMDREDYLDAKFGNRPLS
jgi:hypothetical protein